MARKITLKWNLDQSMLAYEIQLAGDIAFKKIIKTKRVQDPKVTLDLAVGTYYYRVRYIDKDNEPLYWSKPSKVNIIPQPPKAIAPNDAIKLIYYELKPKIKFSWQGHDKSEKYQLVLRKMSGEEVYRKSLKEREVTLDELGKGEFTWQVRSVHQKAYKSDYTKKRKIKIVQKDLSEPELISPKALRPQIKSNKSFKFKWIKDPNSNFTDIELQETDLKKTIKDLKLQNIEGDVYSYSKGLPAGNYSWSVRTKEGEKTPGKTSEPVIFGVYPHVIERGSFKFEYGYSSASFEKANRSLRTGTEVIDTKTASTSLSELSTYYIFTDWLGIGADWQMTTAGDDPWGKRYRKVSYNLHFHGGSSYFSNLVTLGYREMIGYETYNNSSGNYTDFTMQGVVIGTDAAWAVSHQVKIMLKLLYFKPLSLKESVGALNADIGEYAFGFGYNVWDMFWVNLSYRYLIEVSRFQHVEASGNTYSTTERTEPFYLSISYNY